MKRDIKKSKRGRPQTTGTGKMIALRIHDPMLKALDRFIKEQDGKPTRPEAVRMILTDALISYGFAPLEVPPPIKADAN